MGAMTPRMKQGIMAITADADGNFYYNDALDGKWGPKSKAAAERFLRDFTGEKAEESATPGPKPASVWDGIKYFTKEECCCRCKRKYCDGTKEPERELLEVADEIRETIGGPLIPTSVIRCEEWNEICGGVANSRHKLGKAMDAWVPGMTAAELLAIAQKNPRVRYAYAVDELVVHFDVE